MESAMHFIADNCIRMLIFEAAEETVNPIDRIRFSKRKRIQMISALYNAIASAKSFGSPGPQ